MISSLLGQLGFGSLFFTTGSGLADTGTSAIGQALLVLAGNLAAWGS